METIQEAILEAIEKMRSLMKNRETMSDEDIKIDIAVANTTSQLAKAYVASEAIQFKVNNAEKSNKIMLEETF